MLHKHKHCLIRESLPATTINMINYNKYTIMLIGMCKISLTGKLLCWSSPRIYILTFLILIVYKWYWSIENEVLNNIKLICWYINVYLSTVLLIIMLLELNPLMKILSIYVNSQKIWVSLNLKLCYFFFYKKWYYTPTIFW